MEIGYRVPTLPWSSRGLGQDDVPTAAGGSCFRLSHPQNLEQPCLVPRSGCMPSLCPGFTGDRAEVGPALTELSI